MAPRSKLENKLFINFRPQQSLHPKLECIQLSIIRSMEEGGKLGFTKYRRDSGFE